MTGMDCVASRLQIDRQKVIDRVVKDVTAVLKKKSSASEKDGVCKETEDNKRRMDHLIDMCCRGLITDEEFLRQKNILLDEKDALEERLRVIETTDRTMQRGEAFLKELRTHIEDALASDECKEIYYRSILEKMVVNDREHIDVYLQLLSGEQRFLADTINKSVKFGGILQKRTTGNTDVPISVSVARMRSSGME